MGKEKEFTLNVQLKHLQQYSAGDADQAEDLLMMAQSNLHAITQFTGVVSVTALVCLALTKRSAVAYLTQQVDSDGLGQRHLLHLAVQLCCSGSLGVVDAGGLQFAY